MLITRTYLVACHQADATARYAIPQAQATITGSSRHVIGIGMELDNLWQKINSGNCWKLVVD